jgi:hypothetical protein
VFLVARTRLFGDYHPRKFAVHQPASDDERRYLQRRCGVACMVGGDTFTTRSSGPIAQTGSFTISTAAGKKGAGSGVAWPSGHQPS